MTPLAKGCESSAQWAPGGDGEVDVTPYFRVERATAAARIAVSPHQVCQYFGIIWDDAEELQRLADLSHPRVVVDTAKLDPLATLLANLLAERIAALPPERVEAMLRLLDQE